MASAGISAQGSTLKIGTNLISNIISFSGLDGEAPEIDVTNLDSSAKEYVAGLPDYGGFSFEFHPDYSDVGQNALRDAVGTVVEFVLTLPDATTVTFNALVKNASSINAGTDAAITSSASLKLTGAPTIA